MRTDGQIQQDVIDELHWEPAVQADHIGVEVRKGIVTLAGQVGSYMEKYAAEHTAQRVAGVRGVAVDLEVVLPGESHRTDADIADAAIRAIEWSASIPRDSVKVLVEDGHVTLSGTVPWAFAREAASSCVRGLVGVKDVVNLVTIKPPATTHDIKGKIEAALQRQAHLHSKAITVGVERGTVTLSGKVESLGERNVIEQAVWNAPGVKHVVDHLQVH
ncbi:MAG: BON domain-containing protein [Rhodanobacter sp.]